MCILSAKACPTLWDPMDCNPPGFSVRGISQARIVQWVAISSSRGSSQPRDGNQVSCIGRQILYLLSHQKSLRGKGYMELMGGIDNKLYSKNIELLVLKDTLVVVVIVLDAQLCLTLYDPMDYTPPGSSVRGILQGSILEWVAISSSRGSSQPRDGTHASCLGRWILGPLSFQGSPCHCLLLWTI